MCACANLHAAISCLLLSKRRALRKLVDGFNIRNATNYDRLSKVLGPDSERLSLCVLALEFALLGFLPEPMKDLSIEQCLEELHNAFRSCLNRPRHMKWLLFYFDMSEREMRGAVVALGCVLASARLLPIQSTRSPEQVRAELKGLLRTKASQRLR